MSQQAERIETIPDTVVVSIVVPCLNEELVIGEFVDWCQEGLRKAGVSGEILIVDSSTDRSPEIAEAHGARVLRVPRRGLGQAYKDALPHIRGKFVIMGDADLTYDFREIAPFVAKLDEGYDYVMGSRLLGEIEEGAMPWLHQYFGTPLTTWLLNFIYRTNYSDIHCGMRAMTKDALLRIDLRSSSWEYASEMVLKSSLVGLRNTEIPINFYKDREGRESHHKRSGWFSPWQAGWINLKAMFLFAPDFFLFWPGLALLLIGLILCVPMGLTNGPISIFGFEFNLHWMLLGSTLGCLGYSGLHLALVARAHFNFNPPFTEKLRRVFSYDRGMIVGILMMSVGVLLDLKLMLEWLAAGRELKEISYSGVLGLFLIILGFQTATSTLILQMILLDRRSPAPLE